MAEEDDGFDLDGMVEDIDALPENIRGAYRKDENGGYRLRVRATDDGWAFKNVGGLQSALERQKEESRKAKESAAKYQTLAEKIGDHDPDELLETFNRVRSGKMTGSEEVDRVKTSMKRQMEEALQKQAQEKDEKINGLSSELQRRLIDMEAISACANLGAKSKLLLPHIRERCEVREVDGGTLEAVVLNDRGEPRVSNRDGQTYMTVEEFVTEEMKNDPEFAIAFSQPQGGRVRERFDGSRGGGRDVKPGKERFERARAKQLRGRG